MFSQEYVNIFGKVEKICIVYIAEKLTNMGLRKVRY